MLENLQLVSLLFVFAALTMSALVFLAGAIALLHYQPPWLWPRGAADDDETPEQTPLDGTPPNQNDPGTDEAMKKKKEDEQAAQERGAGRVTRNEVIEALSAQLGPILTRLQEIERRLPEEKAAGKNGADEAPSEELKLLKEIHAQLQSLPGAWVAEVDRLPALLIKSLVQHTLNEKEAAKKRRREEAEKKAREAERRALEERANLREAQHAGFRRRFEAVTSQSDMYGIASLVKELNDDLPTATDGQPSYAEALPPYLSFVSKAEEVRSKLSDFDGHEGNQPDGAADALEAGLKELEASAGSLSESHNAVWLISLLEEAGRQSPLREKADRLKQLLNLEDVTVELDTEVGVKDLQSLEPVEYRGEGKRPFIQEVLEGGYRLKDSKTVIKQPKVIVRLEN